jgi:hypothetical protein
MPGDKRSDPGGIQESDVREVHHQPPNAIGLQQIGYRLPERVGRRQVDLAGHRQGHGAGRVGGSAHAQEHRGCATQVVSGHHIPPMPGIEGFTF